MVFALWGVVISAVYMLRAYRAIFLGTPVKDIAEWADPVKSLRWPVILLLAALLIAGFAPGIFLAYVQPSIQALLPK
jgi:NADH-quinone oxidoreductase subunit M